MKQRFFFLGLIVITLPLLAGAGLVTGRERLILGILSLFLLIFHLFKLKGLLNFTIFLSLFISIFLSSRFIFFGRLDPFFFQAVILAALLLSAKKGQTPKPQSESVPSRAGSTLPIFAIGIICLVIATFLLQFFVNRVLLGFYLNIWIDLKRHWPVFLFCITYFIACPVRSTKEAMHGSKISNGVKVSYFMGLFIITGLLSYFNPPEGGGGERCIAAKKIERNLAFFYKDRENWKDMSSPFRRGLVYEYLGLWAKAGNEFKRILIASPEDIDAHFNLARSYEAEKFWYEAMVEYGRVVELDPYYRGSHYGLAVAYDALGETEKAEKEFLKEIEINPEEIRAYIALEELYARQGLVKVIEKLRARRLRMITAAIHKKDIGDDNLRMFPVVLNGGAVTVEIVARGTQAQGFWPRMEVWLSKGGRLVRGGDRWVKSDTWKSYYFYFNALPGEEKFIVHFVNDFFGGIDNDRNLYIKQINFK